MDLNSDTLRLLDGYEWTLSFIWLSVEDVFQNFSREGLQRFLAVCDNALSTIPIFNLGMRAAGPNYYWIIRHFSSDEIVSEPWDDNFINTSKDCPIEPIYNYSGTEKNTVVPFRISYSVSDKDNSTFRVKLYLSHCIADGRSLFDTYQTLSELIKMAFNNKTSPLPRHEKISKAELLRALGEFGKLDCYQNLSEKELHSKEPLDSWKIPFGAITPRLSESQRPVYVNHYLTYSYEPVKSYCRSLNVSVQALLMAAMTRAMRKYNKLSQEHIINVYVPYNTRNSPYATEYCKESRYFSRAGALFIPVLGQTTLELEIQEAMRDLTAAKDSPDPCLQVIKSAAAIDPQTMIYTPPKGAPNLSEMEVTTASNIGKVTGTTPVMKLYSMCLWQCYSVVLYSYYTTNTLYLMIFRPNCVDKSFSLAIEDSISEIMCAAGSTKVAGTTSPSL